MVDLQLITKVRSNQPLAWTLAGDNSLSIVRPVRVSLYQQQVADWPSFQCQKLRSACFWQFLELSVKYKHNFT